MRTQVRGQLDRPRLLDSRADRHRKSEAGGCHSAAHDVADRAAADRVTVRPLAHDPAPPDNRAVVVQLMRAVTARGYK